MTRLVTSIFAAALAAAVLRAGVAAAHPGTPALALFSFAVSAFGVRRP